MVRLQPEGGSSSGASEPGAQAQVVDDLLAGYRRGAPPTSSLDYKAGVGDRVLPPPKADAAPPLTLDAAQLAGLSREELLRRLQEHPELARQLAMQQAQAGGGPPGSGGGAPRARGGSVRLQQLQANGVPVAQWAVLLVLLAFGAWRLYGALKGKPSSAARGSGGRKAGPKGKGTPARQGKGKEAVPASAAKSKPVAAAEAKLDKPSSSSKNGTAASAPAKKKPKTKPKASVGTKASAGNDSDDDDSSIEAPTPVAKAKLKASSPSKASAAAPNARSVVVEPVPAEDGWQVVGGNGVAKAKKKTKPDNGQSEAAEPPAENAAPASAAVAAPPSSDLGPPAAAAAPAVPSDEEAVPSKSSKKKKNKRSKAAAAAAPVSTTAAVQGTPNTAADAALAARLQEAEDKLDAAPAEDEWAEVTTKSKKKDKN